MSLHEFLNMGGFAMYVWPAYAVFFVVLIADFLAPALRRRRLVRELRARLARQRAREQRSSTHDTPATEAVAHETPPTS